MWHQGILRKQDDSGGYSCAPYQKQMLKLKCLRHQQRKQKSELGAPNDTLVPTTRTHLGNFTTQYTYILRSMSTIQIAA